MDVRKQVRYRRNMTSSTDGSWPLSGVVAQQVNTIRKRAGMNREMLAETCRALGAPDTLTAIAVGNIERHRRAVTTDELAIFARALGVPPVLLLFPVGTAEEVEVLPGQQLPTWQAAKWFTGEGPLYETDEWEQVAAPLQIQRQHDHRVGVDAVLRTVLTDVEKREALEQHLTQHGSGIEQFREAADRGKAGNDEQ